MRVSTRCATSSPRWPRSQSATHCASSVLPLRRPKSRRKVTSRLENGEETGVWTLDVSSVCWNATRHALSRVRWNSPKSTSEIGGTDRRYTRRERNVDTKRESVGSQALRATPARSCRHTHKTRVFCKARARERAASLNLFVSGPFVPGPFVPVQAVPGARVARAGDGGRVGRHRRDAGRARGRRQRRRRAPRRRPARRSKDRRPRSSLALFERGFVRVGLGDDEFARSITRGDHGGVPNRVSDRTLEPPPTPPCLRPYYIQTPKRLSALRRAR